ncbi:MAG: pilus assembly protein [Proteobacteria bacterium]|nr:pilus assembly protein [Pseudomonadota bacterium]
MSAVSLPRVPSAQRGAALMVVLVLLVIMTLLGLASLRGTLMTQRMSANMYDRNISLQAAESALRQGEAVVAAGTLPDSSFTAACTGGLCAQQSAAAGTADRWANPTFAGWRNGTTLASDANMTPQYFIELMGNAPNWPGCDQEIPMHPNCLTPRYRVTARNLDPTAAGNSDRSMVVLQSNYAAALPSP